MKKDGWILKSLMMIITPDIVSSFNRLKVCNDNNVNKTLDEHQIILEHIINKDSELAANAMEQHLKDVLEFSQKL